MEEKKEIFRARSKENGIVIYSNKNPLLCYEAYIDEKGEIHTSPIISVMSELKDFSGTLIATDVKRQIKLTSYLRIALCILSILSIVITQKITIAIGMMYFAICASREVVNLVTFIYDVKIGSRQALGRFHAAEHQALIAYKRYQRIPTMEEVRKETRFDQDCGSRLIIDKVMGFLLLSILSSNSVGLLQRPKPTFPVQSIGFTTTGKSKLANSSKEGLSHKKYCFEVP